MDQCLDLMFEREINSIDCEMIENYAKRGIGTKKYIKKGTNNKPGNGERNERKKRKRNRMNEICREGQSHRETLTFVIHKKSIKILFYDFAKENI